MEEQAQNLIDATSEYWIFSGFPKNYVFCSKQIEWLCYILEFHIVHLCLLLYHTTSVFLLQ